MPHTCLQCSVMSVSTLDSSVCNAMSSSSHSSPPFAAPPSKPPSEDLRVLPVTLAALTGCVWAGAGAGAAKDWLAWDPAHAGCWPARAWLMA